MSQSASETEVNHGARGMTMGDFGIILRHAWWKILSLTIAVGAAAFLMSMWIPDVFTASAVITPATEDRRQNPVLGSLASIGISMGSPTRIEDLEALFKSNDLAVRVFRKYKAWPYIHPDRYDPKTGMVLPSRLEGFFGGSSVKRTPTDWDAVRAVKKGLKVAVNRRAGLLTLSFECQSRAGSAEILGFFLEEARSRLQEEVLEKAKRNKQFLAGEISKTVDVLTRDRLFTLYGQEIEKEMLAHNRQQFMFTIIDSPMAPDKKSGPRRIRIVSQAVLIALFAWSYLFFRIGKDRTVVKK